MDREYHHLLHVALGTARGYWLNQNHQSRQNIISITNGADTAILFDIIERGRGNHIDIDDTLSLIGFPGGLASLAAEQFY